MYRLFIILNFDPETHGRHVGKDGVQKTHYRCTIVGGTQGRATRDLKERTNDIPVFHRERGMSRHYETN